METNLTRNHEVLGSIPDLAQWVKDPVLLWLWHRLAPVAPIRPLAWELRYAMGVALKSKKKKKNSFYGNIVDLQCCLWCTAKVIQLYTHTYNLFFTFFSVMIYYSTLNIVPCAI